MVSHRNLSDSKSLPVTRTHLSILADHNNAVVWMVSTRPLIPKSSSSCTNPFETVPSAPITIGITVIFMFHSFFCSLARFRYLSLFRLSFSLTLWSEGTAKLAIQQVLFFADCHWIIIIITIWSFRVFHISISWWFFTGVWVTASLLKSPGLVSWFWPFSVMLSFG